MRRWVWVVPFLVIACSAPVTEFPTDEAPGVDAGGRADSGLPPSHDDTGAPDPESTDSAPPVPADGGAPAPPSKDGGAPSPPVMDAGAKTHEQHCVDVINAFRAKIGRPALARSSALETFAAAGAKADSESGDPHGHFIATSGGGVAWAENEVPGWPGEIDSVIEDGTQMMWDEGPGGGHYENLSSSSYKQVGCGFYVTPGGDVWVTQDFR
ncbi:MAG: CAP domain-containing protein [Polyangiales bacterium]